MPVYQGEAYLAETLDNLLSQEFADFVLLISDNASTDATAEICHDYLARDNRIRYVRNDENVGAARNYNQVFELTTGRYFKWVSYDDLLEPEYLLRCVEVLDDAPLSVALCYPRTTIIDADGAFVRHHDDHFDIRSEDPAERLRQFAWKWSWCNPCFGLHRRDILSTTRLVEPYISSDVTLLAELALRGEFWELPERLFLRRVHQTSSRQGQVTLEDVATWFAPGRRPGRLHPRNRVFLEILRSIERAQLSRVDRMRCHAAFVAAWTERRGRVVGGRLTRRVAESCRTP
jgi:glycosyltransferase involved in cell wall biosynthesis